MVGVHPYDIEVQVLQRYTGEALLQRLFWIVAKFSNNNNHEIVTTGPNGTPVVRAAFEAAIQCCMQWNNTSRYRDVFHHYNTLRNEWNSSTSGSHDSNKEFELHYDTQWYQEVSVQNRTNRDILQSRLQAAQAHLNKDAIRTCYLAIAEFAAQVGDINEAFHSVLRAKDYCTSRHQHTSVSLQILLYALWIRNYHAVRDHVYRLEQTISTTQTIPSNNPASLLSSNIPDPGNSIGVQNCVRIASGLEKLASHDYRGAAERFRAVALSGQNNNNATKSSSSSSSPESTGGATDPTQQSNNWDTIVLAPDDIALYAGFLTLAAEDNRTVALSLAEDVEALELAPHIKDVIIQFVRLAKYQTAYAILEQRIIPILEHDLYMSSHLEILLQQIRTKAIVQYWKPYQIIPLNIMANELGSGIVQPPKQSTESETTFFLNSDPTSSNATKLLQSIISLMSNNRSLIGYDSRIDLETNSLVRDIPNEEERRLQHTSQVLHASSQRTLNDSYSMLVRMTCFEQNLFITDPEKKKKQHDHRGGGGGGGGVAWGGYGENERSHPDYNNYDNDDDDEENQIMDENQHDHEPPHPYEENDVIDDDENDDKIAYDDTSMMIETSAISAGGQSTIAEGGNQNPEDRY